MQEDVESSAGVRPGDVLAGKYRIERVLGIGGMGVVVAANHILLDEKVAIKFLLPDMLRSEEVVARFAREARAAVKIKSEHVARVFDVGTLESGAPYMVMEFLEGADLADWIRQRGPLPVEQAVDFVLQACVAVANAHALGIIHRDLKPANLFCIRGSDGALTIKVLDFGISKVTHLSASDAGGSMTHTSAVMGSPFYMSPEQMQSARDVDARTDIWALGIVLYELLSGVTPFTGTSYAEIAIKVATGPLTPLRGIRPEVPVGIETVILNCLAKDRNQRYAHVGELALALAEFGSKRSRGSIERVLGIIQASGLSSTIASYDRVVASSPQRDEPAGTLAASAHTTSSGGRRPKVAAALGIAAAGSLALAVGWVVLAGRANGNPAPEAATTALVAASAVPARSAVVEPDKAPEVTIAAATVAASAEPPPSNEPAKTKTGTAKPLAAQAHAKPAPPTPTPAPSTAPTCHVVKYFDADGETRFRRECP